MNSITDFFRSLFSKPVHTPIVAVEPKTVPLKPAPVSPEKKQTAAEIFRKMIVTVAREELAKGIREVTRNQHPELVKYWKRTSYGSAGFNNREPWCAAFLAWLVYEAAFRVWGDSMPFSPCRSAGVISWPAWAKTAPGWKCLPPSTRVEPGDIVCWDWNGKSAGGTHIGLGTADEHKTQFATIEGNTNGAGSRDGDGLYAKNTRTRVGCIAILRYVG